MHMNTATAHKQPLDRLAFAVSALSSPFLIVTVFGIIPIVAYAPDTRAAALWSAAYFVTVVALPFLYILSGVLGRTVTDMHVAVHSERSLPILSALAGCFACCIAFAALGVPRELQALALTVTLNGLAFLLANEYTKISFHVGTFVGSVLAAGLLVNPWLLLLLAAVPAIAWARSYRGKHTPLQSMLGAAVSAAGTLAVFGATGLL